MIDMIDIIKEIFISEKEFTGTNYERLKKKSYIDSHYNMYLKVDSLIKITITGSNNITLRKVNVKPCGFQKMYMDRDLIEDNLYQRIDQFNERKVTPTIF